MEFAPELPPSNQPDSDSFNEVLPSRKKALRRALLQQRRQLPTTVWQQQSQQLCKLLESFPAFQTARTVLAYFSVNQEPDLSELWHNYTDKNWGFPRCVGSTLHWHCWQPGEASSPGSYGIPEPLPTAETIAPSAADLILVPAVACDRQGNRLGYGGGFYDRTLAQLTPQNSTSDKSAVSSTMAEVATAGAETASSITTVGIIFDFALLDQLPVEVWDYPLQQICTEQQRLSFSHGSSTPYFSPG